MKYGYFDDKNMEYVIERPDTPAPWSNYLGNTNYGAIITNNAGGYSFFKSSAQGRFIRYRTNSIPSDQPGRYIYFRNNADGDYWSASWQPVGKSLSEYRSECRHGTAYTTIKSNYRSIISETTYFVPLGKNYEIWDLTLKNNDDKKRTLSVFSFVEFSSEWHLAQDLINLQFTQYTVKMDFADGIVRYAMLDNVPEDPDNFQNRDQRRHAFFGVVGADSADFDTDRDAFIGPYRSYSNPLAVESGKCSGSLAHGDNGCGALRSEFVLAPGESKRILLILGIGKAETTGKEVLSHYSGFKKADEEFTELKDHWRSKLERFKVKTPEQNFDSMINVWGAYNCLMTYSWSRAASLVYSGERDGLGYRDTVQDILGAVSLIPDEAAGRLELMISGQLSHGGAMPVIKQFSHKPSAEQMTDPDKLRSDDSLWLFNTIPAYVKETGKIDFFKKVIPYADKGSGTVLDHLRRAIGFNMERRGAHGLPCGLSADWNDCLKLGYRGESIFVAFQLRFAIKTYIEICHLIKEYAQLEQAEKQLNELDLAIHKHTWDGEWFVRAYGEDGSVIGSSSQSEGSIFLNTQSWAVISGAATTSQAEKAMDSVFKKLATDFGIMLCAPPFKTADYHVIRAVVLNEGQKENAGIFCHPQGWAIMAECLLGNGARAYRYFKNFMPSEYNDKAEVRQIEPYVYCQSTHSKYSRRFGASRLPWLTGAATWAYYSATQYIIGIRPDYYGLRISPCLPPEWQQIEVNRIFRGKKFKISIKNGAKGKGISKLAFNGEKYDGELIYAIDFKNENIINVELS
jgi:cellobiose phosphorylase